MKTKRFLLAVAYAATAFTFSACSSDEPNDGGGSSFSDLPKQVYFVEGKAQYTGSSNIELRIPHYMGIGCSEEGGGNGIGEPLLSSRQCECDDYNGDVHECDEEEYRNRYESKPAGRIQNGQVSLELPTSIDSKYLSNFENMLDICGYEKENGEECEVSFPKNLTAFRYAGFGLSISGKSGCELFLAVGSSEAHFYYVSESGKVTGRTCSDYDSSFGCYRYRKYDLDFSKGWNVVYRYYYDDDRNREYTTDPSKAGKSEWLIECDDDDDSAPQLGGSFAP